MNAIPGTEIGPLATRLAAALRLAEWQEIDNYPYPYQECPVCRATPLKWSDGKGTGPHETGAAYDAFTAEQEEAR